MIVVDNNIVTVKFSFKEFLKKVNFLFKKEDQLFDGDGTLFKELLLNADCYGEYGVGQSTLYVNDNSECNIIAVETSKQWFNKISSKVDKNKLIIEHIDLGEVGDWGRPKSYKKRDNIKLYISSIWKHDLKPNLILIDGRFRVACFLFSLINAKEGSVIIFDDYVSREYYYVVEEVIKPNMFCGRQAIFIKKDFNKDLANTLFEKFLYVMD